MIRHLERRTSWRVVIAYLFIAAFCGGMWYYIYKLQSSIQNQRINNNVQNNALDLTNRFTQLVHQAQAEANLYAFTDNPAHLTQFGILNNEISLYADSILMLMPNKQNEQRIREVERLIMRKGQISYVLSRQFYYYDPLAEIDAKLKAFTPPDPPLFNANGNDSVVQQGNNPTHVNEATIDILSDLKILSEKARSEYKKRIREYEKKTEELITDDNHLSEEIAELLLALNKEILDTSLLEMEISEQIIDENMTATTYIGAAVLILIVIFIIMILNDVNKGFRARRAAEKARNEAEEARKKTEELMESRHKMLLTVSHDIKTPLTSIIGNVELMDNTGNEKEVMAIQQSADHILSLLSNLLEFSSLEQGILQVEKSPYNVRQLCDETASMFESIAHKKNLRFNFKNEIPDNLFADSDRLKTKQIISNLISNAIKYTIEGHVGFEASLEDGHLVFRIDDSGIGIPEKERNEIFKPFVRTDSGSKISEGSGYGLSVVKGLVDLMEGEITVESETGKGSVFTVNLPVDLKTINEKGDENHDEEHKDESASPVEQKHILIIDDDDTLLTVISNMLGKLGHQVMICRSKNDIDEALRQPDSFDSVLTDREMGALSGNDILKIFKKSHAEKPVYLMTARMDYDIAKAKEEGFDGFLAKPFSLNALERIFGRHASEENKEQSSSFTDFPELCEMMGDDEDAIRGVLTVFAQSTADHLVALNECLENDDFVTAHGLCHKMLPMFIQLQQDQAVPFLSKMNDLRGHGANDYPAWKEDAVRFMTQADKLLDTLSEKYGIG